MKKLIILLLLTVGPGLCGCSRDAANPELAAADAVIESAPDSALVRLEAVDRSAFTPADSDYYALLMTQAQVKNNMRVTSDSLISRAREAYRYSSDRDLRRRAAFYSAQVDFDAGRLRDAMRDAIEAYELAKSEGNDYWHAKAAELIADIFYETYHFSKSEAYVREASDYYLRAGKIPNHRYTLCDWALNIIIRGQVDSAFAILDSIRALSLSEVPQDSALYNYATWNLVSLNDFMNDYDTANELIGDTSSKRVKSHEFSNALIQSYISEKKHEVQSMNSFVSKAYELSEDDRDKIKVTYASYCHEKALGNYPKAVELADSLIDLECSITNQLIEQSVLDVQNDYYLKSTIAERERVGRLRLTITLFGICALIIIILLIIIYHLILKKKQSAFEENLSAMLEMNEKSKEESLRDRNILSTLFKGRWDTFNMLCNQYGNMDKDENSSEIVVRNIKSELQKMKNSDNINYIVELTDSYYNGLISTMRREYSFLKSDDVTFLALIIAGLSGRAVSYMMDIKPNYLYVKKKRLTDKIAASDSACNQQILDLLARK